MNPPNGTTYPVPDGGRDRPPTRGDLEQLPPHASQPEDRRSPGPLRLRAAVALLRVPAAMFWRAAAMRAKVETRLENLRAGDK